MDGSKFDALTKGLATGRSRRSVLRGLIGGGTAVVAARAGTTLAAPADKVTICHFTGSETNPYNIITISGNALAAHQANHGDFLYLDECCIDSDCNTGFSCNEGTCDCLCAIATNAETEELVCVTFEGGCDVGPGCDEAADCPEGWLCIFDGFCEAHHCHPPCTLDDDGLDRRAAEFSH